MKTESVADMKQPPGKLCKAQQEIAELKIMLQHIVEPDYARDYWIRLDGRLNGKMLNLAEHLLVLLEHHYPTQRIEHDEHGNCPENCQIYQHLDYHD